MHPRFIYKVCDVGLWQDAQKAGVFRGADIDLQDGYIHFSTADQLRDTLAQHFAGRRNLCLLTIDSAPLDIKWEPARGGALFPHLYALLPLHSVVTCHVLELAADGLHTVLDSWLAHS